MVGVFARYIGKTGREVYYSQDTRTSLIREMPPLRSQRRRKGLVVDTLREVAKGSSG
jgi:hypothetical protein